MTRKLTGDAAAALAAKELREETRRQAIVDARNKRIPWREIAAEHGISIERAAQIYRAALARTPVLGVDDYRFEQLELIDASIHALLQLGRDPAVHPRDRVNAWREIREFLERQAKLLGLDAPTRSMVITVDYLDAEIARLESELGIAGRVQAGALALPAGAGAGADPAGGAGTPGVGDPVHGGPDPVGAREATGGDLEQAG